MLILGLLAANQTSSKLFKDYPPGTVYLSDSLYIDATPVKTMDYLEFLRSVRVFYNDAAHDSISKMPLFGLSKEDVAGLFATFKGDSLEYQKMLTRTWMTYSNHEKRYDVDYRLKISKYLDYPITNITFEQIKHYCRWRTDMVKLYYATNCKTEKDRLKYPLNFKYRIPKRKEWEFALSKYFHDITVPTETKETTHDGIDNTAAPYFKEKKKTFYYSTLNSAEILDNEIVAFDFKWVKSVGLGDVSYFKFTEPKDFISFRCVCEVVALDPVEETK